jgi:hypothetical protein
MESGKKVSFGKTVYFYWKHYKVLYFFNYKIIYIIISIEEYDMLSIRYF